MAHTRHCCSRRQARTTREPEISFFLTIYYTIVGVSCRRLKTRRSQPVLLRSRLRKTESLSSPSFLFPLSHVAACSGRSGALPWPTPCRPLREERRARRTGSLRQQVLPAPPRDARCATSLPFRTGRTALVNAGPLRPRPRLARLARPLLTCKGSRRVSTWSMRVQTTTHARCTRCGTRGRTGTASWRPQRRCGTAAAQEPC